MNVGIKGFGAYAPENIVDNAYFEQFLETSDEWISKMTGIKERRWSRDDQDTSDLAYEASKKAIEDALTAKNNAIDARDDLTPEQKTAAKEAAKAKADAAKDAIDKATTEEGINSAKEKGKLAIEKEAAITAII